MRKFLGVDGGGTKTEFLLVDENGSKLARHLAGSSYYLQIGLDGLGNLLFDGVNRICEMAQISPNDIDFSFFGLPAFGEDSSVIQRLSDLPSEILPAKKFLCGNDMICGWAGSLAGADGINIVAGTGSIAYGEFAGNCARAGGFGELFSDEGSAHWIGIQTLNVFSKMADNRLEKGPLYKIIMEKFALRDALDICGITLGPPQMSRDEIAAFSKLAFQAAENGDVQAIEIFKSAANELAQIVFAVANQLPLDPNAKISLSYSGGVFQSGDLIMTPFKYLISAKQQFNLIEPILSPAIGACLYAMRQANFKPNHDALKSFAMI